MDPLCRHARRQCGPRRGGEREGWPERAPTRQSQKTVAAAVCPEGKESSSGGVTPMETPARAANGRGLLRAFLSSWQGESSNAWATRSRRRISAPSRATTPRTMLPANQRGPSPTRAASLMMASATGLRRTAHQEKAAASKRETGDTSHVSGRTFTTPTWASEVTPMLR